MNETERLELMLEYVAGTLDADAAERVRAALDGGDPGWAAARAEAEATLAAYAGAIKPVTPGHDLKSTLMTRVARDQDATLRHKPLPDPHDPYRGLRRFAQAFTAVAAIILIGVLVNVYVNRRIAAERKTLAKEYETLLREKEGQIQILNMAIQQDEQIRKVLSSGKFKVVDLGSDKTKAVGRILIDEDTRTWHVFAAGLAQQPDDKVYELWYITPDQRKIAAGAFKVGPGGHGSLRVTVPQEVGPVAVAAITDEKAPLVQVPAGDVHLAGKIP